MENVDPDCREPLPPEHRAKLIAAATAVGPANMEVTMTAIEKLIRAQFGLGHPVYANCNLFGNSDEYSER